MSNRTALSRIRDELQDLERELGDVERTILSISAEGEVRRARADMRSAVDRIGAALTENVNLTAVASFARPGQVAQSTIGNGA